MMSDPVTNAEIEDVLSSIRRLVSEDTRNISRVKTVDPSSDRGRLVLTPSLRVAEISDPEAPPEDAAPHNPDEDVREAWSDETGPPWRDPQATLYEAADGPAAPEFVDDDDGRMGDATDLARIAEPDGPESGEPAEWQDGDPVAEAVAQPWNDGNGDGEQDDEDASLEATVEALETAIGETPDQWEPDGEGGDDYAGTPVQTLEWQDHETTAPNDDPAEEVWRQEADDLADAAIGDAPEEAREPVGLDPMATEETILDEESLRELVTDIVRQELQGALGERITRNVRKLVRREIHRALTAQELE